MKVLIATLHDHCFIRGVWWATVHGLPAAKGAKVFEMYMADSESVHEVLDMNEVESFAVRELTAAEAKYLAKYRYVCNDCGRPEAECEC